MTLDDIIDQILALLQRDKRLPYRVLKRRFDLDDNYLEDLKEEIIYAKQLAIDEDGRVLVWIGETSVPMSQPAPQTASLTAVETSSSQIPTLEAERRQLTVEFCDLVGSTALSGQLDHEDLREVIRTYQEAAAVVVRRYEGHIAQYLGDGLLIYSGYPQAHEDDAHRAVRIGLGIIDAIEQVNPRLQQQYGVHLAVRVGIHT